MYVEENFNKEKLEVQEPWWEYLHPSFFVDVCLHSVCWLFLFCVATLGLPKGSSFCPIVEVPLDLKVDQQNLQEALDRKRTRDAAFASGEAATSVSTRPKGKKPKRRHSSKTEAKEQPPITEEISKGSDIVVLDEEEIEINA